MHPDTGYAGHLHRRDGEDGTGAGGGRLTGGGYDHGREDDRFPVSAGYHRRTWRQRGNAVPV